MSEAVVSSARQTAGRHGPRWFTDLLLPAVLLALGIGLVLYPYTTARGIPGDLAD